MIIYHKKLEGFTHFVTRLLGSTQKTCQIVFMKKPGIHFIYVTFPKFSEAKKASKSLLKLKLIACANILPKMKSFYMWNNKLETASECVVLFKTSKPHVQKIEAFLLKNHSYQTPCVANIEIKSLNKSYRDWLLQSLK